MDRNGYAEISNILAAGNTQAAGHTVIITPPVESLGEKSVRHVDLSFLGDTALADVLNILDEGRVLQTDERASRIAGPLLRQAEGGIIQDEDYLTVSFVDVNYAVRPTTSILDEMSAANAALNAEWLRSREVASA